MEWLATIFTSASIPSLIVLVIVILMLFFGVRNGRISFNGKGLKIGQDESTRRLIQSQFEYTNAKIESVISMLPKDLDIYHTKYILARAEDVIQRAIIFNNMTDDEDYVKAKQELVYATVMKRVTNDYFKTDEFKAFCYKFVADLFRDLYRMKRVHTF